MAVSVEDAPAFVAKAQESLAAARSELATDRYNVCASRCYYACFQAAVAALMLAGIEPPPQDRVWSHGAVQSLFAGLLIDRRKRYPAALRSTLPRLASLRERADYDASPVSGVQAARAVSRAAEFVGAVMAREAL